MSENHTINATASVTNRAGLAALAHVGHFHVGFLSFIYENDEIHQR